MDSAPLPCPHCGAPVKLADAHLRVPYRRQHWWQFGEERSEYRCGRCSGFSLLRITRAGYALFGLIGGGFGAGWLAGISHKGLGAIAAIAAFLVSSQAKRLVKS